MLNSIKTICIAGAGTMGSGIAQVCASSGYQTVLFDVNDSVIGKAKIAIEKNLEKLVEKQKITTQQKQNTLDKIYFITEIKEVKGDLIIEAIIENLQVKKEFFQTIASQNPDETILASNTSSISISEIAKSIPHPERFLGIHFFNPAQVMKLVEIISGKETSNEVALFCKKQIEGMSKTCVMAADSPGFIVNRIARHYYLEALKIAEENFSNYETIDALMESCGFKMGPFRLMDLIGIDVNFAVTKSVYEQFKNKERFRPSKIQQQLVEEGSLGRKTKKGFYNYE